MKVMNAPSKSLLSQRQIDDLPEKVRRVVVGMSEENRAHFERQYLADRLHLATVFPLALFGGHHFVVGHAGRGIVFWLLLLVSVAFWPLIVVVGIWYLAEVLAIGETVAKANGERAWSIVRDVRDVESLAGASA